MDSFDPKLDILPPVQQALWPKLEATPHDFVLYGGTAIALRLGHRESIDFDFFSLEAFEPRQLFAQIPYLSVAEITQATRHTLSCRLQLLEGQPPVKVSYFGDITLPKLSPPEQVISNKLKIASMIDLLGTKCATIGVRCEKKDYLDIHAILRQTSLTLTDGVAAAKALYGKRYQYYMTLKALSDYSSGDLKTLDQGIRQDLMQAVQTVDVEKVPLMQPLARKSKSLRGKNLCR